MKCRWEGARKQVSVYKPPGALDEQCVAVVTAALQWGAAAAAAATQRSDRLVDESARAVAAARAEAQSTRHTSLHAMQLYYASVAAQHSDDHKGGLPLRDGLGSCSSSMGARVASARVRPTTASTSASLTLPVTRPASAAPAAPMTMSVASAKVLTNP
jgi:hypothetical protein